MKKLLTMLLFLLLPLSVFASYPTYLKGNSNIEFTYGEKNVAQYLDKKAIMAEEFETGYILSTVQYMVEYAADLVTVKKVTGPTTVLYYYNADPDRSSYTEYTFKGKKLMVPPFVGFKYMHLSLDQGKTWKVFDVTATEGEDMWSLAPHEKITEGVH